MLEGGAEVLLSLSAGMAVYPGDGKPETLLAIADRRLYEAKASAAQAAA